MRGSIPEQRQDSEELRSLRRLIAERAAECGVDLDEPAAIRRLLCQTIDPERAAQQPIGELRAMLVLLYRLEDSSSEDIGIDGLQHLWRQHGEIIAAHAARKT